LAVSRKGETCIPASGGFVSPASLVRAECSAPSHAVGRRSLDGRRTNESVHTPTDDLARISLHVSLVLPLSSRPRVLCLPVHCVRVHSVYFYILIYSFPFLVALPKISGPFAWFSIWYPLLQSSTTISYIAVSGGRTSLGCSNIHIYTFAA
jgi:hypothetical protein